MKDETRILSQILAILFLELFSQTKSFAQKPCNALTLDFVPKMCETQNIGTGGERTKVGFGYNAQFGFSHMDIKRKFYIVVGLGYSSYRLSAAEEQLYLILPKNSFSYQFDYLASYFKVGFPLVFQTSKVTITPTIGLRVLFYLPYKDYNPNDYYNNRNYSRFAKDDDLVNARYNKTLGESAFWNFIFTGGIRLKYTYSRRIDFNASPFIDLGLKYLRTMTYTSDELFSKNEDLHNSSMALSKGDALGLELGISYKLGLKTRK